MTPRHFGTLSRLLRRVARSETALVSIEHSEDERDHEYGNGVAVFTRDGDAARDGMSKTAERYTTGPFAHMLKNSMYVGEVACRGKVHKGE